MLNLYLFLYIFFIIGFISVFSQINNQGCLTENPISFLYQYDDDLQSGIFLANSMLNTMNGIGVENINRLCGGDVSPIVEGMDLISENLSALQDALR